jgi:hypothetical protein
MTTRPTLAELTAEVQSRVGPPLSEYFTMIAANIPRNLGSLKRVRMVKSAQVWKGPHRVSPGLVTEIVQLERLAPEAQAYSRDVVGHLSELKAELAGLEQLPGVNADWQFLNTGLAPQHDHFTIEGIADRPGADPETLHQLSAALEFVAQSRDTSMGTTLLTDYMLTRLGLKWTFDTLPEHGAFARIQSRHSKKRLSRAQWPEYQRDQRQYLRGEAERYGCKISGLGDREAAVAYVATRYGQALFSEITFVSGLLEARKVAYSSLRRLDSISAVVPPGREIQARPRTNPGLTG